MDAGLDTGDLESVDDCSEPVALFNAKFCEAMHSSGAPGARRSNGEDWVLVDHRRRALGPCPARERTRGRGLETYQCGAENPGFAGLVADRRAVGLTTTTYQLEHTLAVLVRLILADHQLAKLIQSRAATWRSELSDRNIFRVNIQRYTSSLGERSRR